MILVNFLVKAVTSHGKVHYAMFSMFFFYIRYYSLSSMENYYSSIAMPRSVLSNACVNTIRSKYKYIYIYGVCERSRKTETLTCKENARATPAAPQPSVQYLPLLLYVCIVCVQHYVVHASIYIYNASQGAKLILKGVYDVCVFVRRVKQKSRDTICY